MDLKHHLCRDKLKQLPASIMILQSSFLLSVWLNELFYKGGCNLLLSEICLFFGFD